MNELIFDRTQADVNYAINHPSSATFLKGAYNYTDLNRIETWCEYLAEKLTSYNYFVKINAKTDWAMSDFPTSQELERIRKNVNDLKQAYFSFTQIPENLEYMTIKKANDIEKILDEIDKIILAMENNFVYSGVAGSGQNRVWQQRFRKPKTWNSQPYKLSQYLSTDTLKMIATDNNIVIENENQEYKSYTLKNIIPDASFENGLWAGGNYSTTEKMFGNKALYFQAGTTIVPTIAMPYPTIGHKYYGRRYIKSNGNNEPADSRFEWWGGDGTNSNWVFAWNNGNHPSWDFNSDMYLISAVEMTQNPVIRCFNVNTTADTWVDGLMIIDLTEAFGKGKEPTKQWCDANIPFFENEYVLQIPKKRFSVQLDKRDDVYASVEAINESMQGLDELVGTPCFYYTLTNLLKPMDDETFDIGSKSTAHVKYGSSSFMITGVVGDNEEYALSTTKYSLHPTHIYFACVEVYSETGTGTIDMFWPSGSPSLFGGKKVYANKWTKWYNRTNRTNFTETNHSYRLDFNNGGVADYAWFDGAMIIDLTEEFGSGNEPSLDWCLNNIPYFTGTQIIKTTQEAI